MLLFVLELNQLLAKLLLTKPNQTDEIGEGMASDHIDRVVQRWKAERPDYDLAPVEIIGRAGRIMEHVDRALEAKFEEFQISRASFDVLAALRRNGKPYKLTQRELMRSLFRTSGSMSLRIDSLQKQGLVERTPDNDDRRSVFVGLTPKGVKLLEAVIPEHLENENSLIAGLNRVERTQLIALLRKWLVSLEDDVANGRQLYLGMTLLDSRASMKMRRAVGLPDVPGLLVDIVAAGSRAEELGFRKGDLVTAIAGQPVTSFMELRKILNKLEPKIKRVKVVRGVDEIEFKLTNSSI
jgi:DNA-binding MarR family transcriptional regulator